MLETRNHLSVMRPLLIKIAPDLTEQDKIDICDVVMDKEVGPCFLLILEVCFQEERSSRGVF